MQSMDAHKQQPDIAKTATSRTSRDSAHNAG